MIAGAGGWRFAPGLWPTIATLIGLLVLLGLGTWQLDRLEWKRALIAERAARLASAPAILPPRSDAWPDWDFRPAVVEGAFRHDLEQLFGVAAIDGRLGHHVLAPLVRQFLAGPA